MKSLLKAATLVLLVLVTAVAVASLVPLSSEALWPIRMVARELLPSFILVNAVGLAMAAAARRRAMPGFVLGIAFGCWPLAQIPGARADLARQWQEQGFAAEHFHGAGLLEVIRRGYGELSSPSIQPEVLTPAIHLYKPADARGPLPIVVDIHGGSWQVGGVRDDASSARMLARAGYAVFAIDYRKAPQFTFPVQIDDVRDSLTWIHEHAREHGADPNHMALLGRSAGGHLAMLAAYTNGLLPIRAVVNIYGPGDLQRLYDDPPSPDPLNVRRKVSEFLGGPPNRAHNDPYVEASPSSHVRAGLPPTLHIQGGADHVVSVERTREMHALLLAQGSRSLLLEMPWADHSFDLVFFGPAASLSEIAIEAFLAETLAVPGKRVGYS